MTKTLIMTMKVLVTSQRNILIFFFVFYLAMAHDSDDESDESDVEEAEKAVRNKKQVLMGL